MEVDLTGDDDAGSAKAAEWTQDAEKSHCLVFSGHFSQADQDKYDAISTEPSVDERNKSMLRWLPVLKECGLTWVSVDNLRLHVHFKDHASLARALKAVPHLVRCGLTGKPNAWKNACVSCSGAERYDHPEALRFWVIARQAVPGEAERLTAMSALLKEMQIDVQSM